MHPHPVKADRMDEGPTPVAGADSVTLCSQTINSGLTMSFLERLECGVFEEWVESVIREGLKPSGLVSFERKRSR